MKNEAFDYSLVGANDLLMPKHHLAPTLCQGLWPSVRGSCCQSWGTNSKGTEGGQGSWLESFSPFSHKPFFYCSCFHSALSHHNHHQDHHDYHKCHLWCNQDDHRKTIGAFWGGAGGSGVTFCLCLCLCVSLSLSSKMLNGAFLGGVVAVEWHFVFVFVFVFLCHCRVKSWLVHFEVGVVAVEWHFVFVFLFVFVFVFVE